MERKISEVIIFVFALVLPLDKTQYYNFKFEMVNDWNTFIKIRSIPQLYEILPEHERQIVDVLRQIIKANLPVSCKEKISFNVPFFSGNRGICIIWPTTIPRGGIKQGVLLGFWYGSKLQDVDNYLIHGTNKQIFYKIYYSYDEIDEIAIGKLLQEAVELDKLWTNLK